MSDESIACCNCSCPINYDCGRFKLFFDGKYVVAEEFTHNNDYTCEHKDSGTPSCAPVRRYDDSLFE
jgi:hypothetical protein